MANNWAGYNVEGLWYMEEAASNNRADSSGNGFDIIEYGGTVANDAVDFQQGAACANFEVDDTAYMAIANSSLDSGFPGHGSWTPASFSVGVFFKPETTGATQVIAGKWTASPDRCWLLYMEADGSPGFSVGYNVGANTKPAALTETMSVGSWYYVCGTYEAKGGSALDAVTVHCWDLGAVQALGTAVTATLDANDDVAHGDDTPAFFVGCSGGPTNYADGKIDELIVTADLLTAALVAEAGQKILGAGVTEIDLDALECTTELEAVQIDKRKVLFLDALECTTELGTSAVSISFTSESQAYSAVATASLPTGASVFTDAFTDAEYTAVGTAEGTYATAGVDYYGKSGIADDYVVVNFFDENADNTTKLTFEAPMQSTYDPSGSNVLLQLFKCSDQSWNTKYTESTAVANEEFLPFGSHVADLTEFYFQRLAFTGTTTLEPALNTTITGGTSGHSGEYVGAELTSGSWGSNPVGFLHLYDSDGVFNASETITGTSFTATTTAVINGKYWAAWRIYQEAA